MATSSLCAATEGERLSSLADLLLERVDARVDLRERRLELLLQRRSERRDVQAYRGRALVQVNAGLPKFRSRFGNISQTLSENLQISRRLDKTRYMF